MIKYPCWQFKTLSISSLMAIGWNTCRLKSTFMWSYIVHLLIPSSAACFPVHSLADYIINALTSAHLPLGSWMTRAWGIQNTSHKNSPMIKVWWLGSKRQDNELVNVQTLFPPPPLGNGIEIHLRSTVAISITRIRGSNLKYLAILHIFSSGIKRPVNCSIHISPAKLPRINDNGSNPVQMNLAWTKIKIWSGWWNNNPSIYCKLTDLLYHSFVLC